MDDTQRSVFITRTGPTTYQATNSRGGVITFGDGDGVDFSAVELLLAALGGCTALTVEALIAKKSDPDLFDLSVLAHKVKDEDGGTSLQDVQVGADIRFPSDAEGQKAESRVEDALEKSHVKYCTVSRTVERETPVKIARTTP